MEPITEKILNPRDYVSISLEDYEHTFVDFDLGKLRSPDFEFAKKNKRIFKIVKPRNYYVLNLKNNFYLLKKISFSFLPNSPFLNVINSNDFNDKKTNLLIAKQFRSYPREFNLALYLVDEDNISVKMRYSKMRYYDRIIVSELHKLFIELEKLDSNQSNPDFQLEKQAKELIKKYLEFSYSTISDKDRLMIIFKREVFGKREAHHFLVTITAILGIALRLIKKEVKLAEDPFFKEPIIYKTLKIFFKDKVVLDAIETYKKEVILSQKEYLIKKDSRIF